MADTVKITVDGQEMEVPAGELLIKAAQDNGTYIPRFCWHPRMNPVGMCRMCLVEIETPRGPMLITACTNPVNEGMTVDTQNDTVKKAQEGILEFLLANHPLDCPVCDKGGECPLQDQAMAYGPGESRFVEIKRHYEKPIPISDLVLLDRERCILCARCTRFSDEISGDPLIEFQDRGNNTEVNTFPDLPFSSYFSGNTVQICPVGALTATAYRFRARPWDLRAVESSAPHDTAQPRITIQVSQNEVLRFLGVDSDAVNHGWLSDKARFGFEYINSDDRLTVPLIRDGDDFREAGWGEALQLVAEQLTSIKEESGPDAIGAIGGAQGTNEDAYALSKFMRVTIGSNNVDAQLDDGLDPRFLTGVVDRGTINDLESAKTVLVWASDLKEEHPTLYLRVRRAAQELGASLIVVHPRATGLDDRATHRFTYRPGSGAETLASLAAGDGNFAEARAALDEGPVVALIGRTGYTEDPRLAEAVAAFARTLDGATVLPLVRRSNTYGALDMGLAPMLLPGRVSVTSPKGVDESWGEIPSALGKSTADMLDAAAAGEVQALILLGADPARDVPDGAKAAAGLEGAQFVVSIDAFLNDSNRSADVVLPALVFGEKDGTVTNLEGRVQKVNAIVPGAGQSRPDWSVIDDVARLMGAPLGLNSAEAISKEIADVAPAYRGLSWDLLEWDARDGAIVPLPDQMPGFEYVPADTPGEVAKGDLVLHSARTMYDDGVMMRNGRSLHALAPGGFAALHSDDAARLGLGEGDQAQVEGSSGSAVLPIVIDDSLARGTVYVPFNQPGIQSLGSGTVVEINKV